ncbi:MAG: GNAT family N-acetyltransferase [Sphaerochaeta sp.]|jgi:ribosomal protein S18 acetylase RimI-like enzyme|nr:GNAT family N-acetyltransferase [Sphaerochaeta sp.]
MPSATISLSDDGEPIISHLCITHDAWATKCRNIRRLEQRCFPVDVAYRPSKGMVFVTVALAGNEIVGFVVGGFRSGGDVFLARVGVLKGLRGKGLARRLVKEFIHQLVDKQGVKTVVTYARRNNPASLNALFAAGGRAYWPKQAFGCADAVYLRWDHD